MKQVCSMILGMFHCFVYYTPHIYTHAWRFVRFTHYAIDRSLSIVFFSIMSLASMCYVLLLLYMPSLTCGFLLHIWVALYMVVRQISITCKD